MSLRSYIDAKRGRAAALAAALGVNPVMVSQWAAGKPVAAERCAAIEAATDREVCRWDLRPTDWHLIWPELVGAEGAPAVPAAAAPFIASLRNPAVA